MSKEKARELESLQYQMIELLDEMRSVVSGTEAESRAESYWMAHITTALSDDHGYLGGSMVTCQDTVNELREEDEPEEDE